ncbi:YcgL domain-containing protein [Porticoccus sp. W117]|uniref:YcgL domain-containing protein n=1 Tax=Porticoccus sp. W117 TaxID=3054777 RepID=UPI0025931F36|nr:YcgL domain-containing protein [Porticoccus sp. W117]MDM3871156.1 YcgL domain-containing protein [Porticoccus sp. W117]
MKTLCTIYKSPHEDELYLYVDHRDQLSRVPEALLEKFGTPQRVTTLPLTPERKLARADTAKVLASIGENGYYLQLPPAKEDYMQEVNQHNHKLAGR